MMTRLIFRPVLPMLIICALSISAADWIGTRIRTIMVTYHEYLGNDVSRIMLLDIQRHQTMPLVKFEASSTAFTWSPDGYIVIYPQLEIIHTTTPHDIHWYLWCVRSLSEAEFCWNDDNAPLAGGSPDYFIPSEPQWSPDSRFIAVTRLGNVHVWDVVNNRTQAVFPCDLWTCSPSPDKLTWLPDNRHLLWVDETQLMMGDIISGEFHRLIEETDTIDLVAASGERLVYYTSDYQTHHIVLFDIEQNTVLNEATIDLAEYYVISTWSPDGEKLLIANGHMLYLLTPDQEISWELEIRAIEPVWTPDSQHIHFNCQHEDSYDICELDIKTGVVSTVYDLNVPDVVNQFVQYDRIIFLPQSYGNFYVMREDGEVRLVLLDRVISSAELYPLEQK